MRTGTRWTIFVMKLPVAFSGGRTLNCAPVAGAEIADRAVEYTARHHVGLHRGTHAGLHMRQLIFLEVRHLHPCGQAPARPTATGCRPPRIGAVAGALIADGAVDRRMRNSV